MKGQEGILGGGEMELSQALAGVMIIQLDMFVKTHRTRLRWVSFTVRKLYANRPILWYVRSMPINLTFPESALT